MRSASRWKRLKRNMEGDDLAAPHAGSEEMMCRRAKQQPANKQAWKLKMAKGGSTHPLSAKAAECGA